MSTHTAYVVENREMETMATRTMKQVVAFLFVEGALTEVQADHYGNNYAIVLRKRSFFSRLFKRNKETRYYIIVKQCDMPKESDDEQA